MGVGLYEALDGERRQRRKAGCRRAVAGRPLKLDSSGALGFRLLQHPTILWAGCGRGTGRPYLAANSDFLYLGSLR